MAFLSVFFKPTVPRICSSGNFFGEPYHNQNSRAQTALPPIAKVLDGGRRNNRMTQETAAGGLNCNNNNIGEVGVVEKMPSRSSPFSTGITTTSKQPLVTSDVGNSTNIRWHQCPVGKHEREKLLGQKGCVLWITGLSGSGKSTLACSLSRALYDRGFLTYILDGDNLRHGLNQDLSFKSEHRAENIRRTAEVAKLFVDAGLICIVSLISPYRKDRQACRELLDPDGNFIEVFMDMSLELCESRDPKGLYKLARQGKIKGFTGIDDPYEPPLNCEITVKNTADSSSTPDAMADQVISYLEKEGYMLKI